MDEELSHMSSRDELNLAMHLNCFSYRAILGNWLNAGHFHNHAGVYYLHWKMVLQNSVSF
jgi:hypothetical protein